MDESIRINDPGYAHCLLGKEDTEGVNRYEEHPKGVFEKPFLDQSPEPGMIDLHEVSSIQEMRRKEKETMSAAPPPNNKQTVAVVREYPHEALLNEKQEKASKYNDCTLGEYITSNPFPRAEQWWKEINHDIRVEWSRLAGLNPPELKDSGLPLPLAQMVEGKINETELEIANFCKLAGLRYKTSREQLEREAKLLHDICHRLSSNLLERVDKLVESFKRMQPE
jgi:hypothetical protein